MDLELELVIRCFMATSESRFREREDFEEFHSPFQLFLYFPFLLLFLYSFFAALVAERMREPRVLTSELLLWKHKDVVRIH